MKVKHGKLRIFRDVVGVAGMCGMLSMAGAGSALAHTEHGHPARIHEGTCEDLGRVVFRLNGIGGSVDQDNAPVATPTAVNPDSASQVMLSETTIDGSIDDVMAADHAVMIYESDEAMDAISCGNVGGAMLDGSLVTGLAEAGVPGHIGFALFQPEGDQIVVSIILGHGMAGVSAAGVADDHDHADDRNAEGNDHEGDEANHDEEHADDKEHAATTTPDA